MSEAPAPLTLLKNAAANLEILHQRPGSVQPLRLVDMREYRALLGRLAAAVADLQADITGGEGE